MSARFLWSAQVAFARRMGSRRRRDLQVLLHALLSAFASSSPDGGLREVEPGLAGVEPGLAGVEPDLRVVTRRGPSGFGVVVRLAASGLGEVNLVTALRGPAAEDGLLRVGDLVLEVDGERIPPGELGRGFGLGFGLDVRVRVWVRVRAWGRREHPARRVPGSVTRRLCIYALW